MADLDKANELQPNNSETLIDRSSVKFEQKDLAGAIADIDERGAHRPPAQHALSVHAYANKKLGVPGRADEAQGFFSIATSAEAFAAKP